jgi:hypothetical protein
MSKPYTKKEVVYYLENDREKINRLQADLYDTYKHVGIYPNGINEVRIICTN